MKLESSNLNRIAKAMLFTVAAGVGLSLGASRLLASANYEPYTFTHFAGGLGGPGYADGSGSAAGFYFPNGVAVDSSNNVYVAEINNCSIRKGILASSPLLLSATVANNQIVLAWPTNYADFTLQSSPDLDSAANWTNITNNPLVLGLQFVVTNPISGGAQFFRLKK